MIGKSNFIILAMWLSAMLFFGGTAGAMQPDWIRAHQKGRLQLPGVYHGVGFAEFEGRKPGYEATRLAKDRALDELCYQLSVSIKSRFADSVIKSGNYEDQHITSSLFISTRQTLSGIKEREKWTDSRQRRHWVLLIIDIQEADRQLEQQKFINEVAERLEHRQEEVQKGLDRITTLLNNNMQAYSERVNELGKLMKIIDSKVGEASAQTKKEYDLIREDIYRLESRRQAYEDRIAHSQKKQSEQIAILIRQNQDLQKLLSRLSGEIQSDYFLSLADDDVSIRSDNSEFWVTIEPDKGQGASYINGERISFRVRASRKCFIKVIYLSSTGKNRDAGEVMMNTLLFPNQHNKDNAIGARETKVIGKMGELEIQPPFGKDVVTVIASENQFTDLPQTLKAGGSGYYSEVTTSTRDAINIRRSGFGVSRPLDAPVPTADKKDKQTVAIATDTCFIVSRPN